MVKTAEDYVEDVNNFIQRFEDEIAAFKNEVENWVNEVTEADFDECFKVGLLTELEKGLLGASKKI